MFLRTRGQSVGITDIQHFHAPVSGTNVFEGCFLLVKVKCAQQKLQAVPVAALHGHAQVNPLSQIVFFSQQRGIEVFFQGQMRGDLFHGQIEHGIEI
jgi:hypothetical protein